MADVAVPQSPAETDSPGRHRRDRSRDLVAAAGLVLAILCAAGAFAALSRVLNTSDETAHMDYAYQVWHGRLPVFENGLLFRPRDANVPPVQWEAQHPPLFYAIAAPIVGPVIGTGHWLVAALAGRGLTVLVAVACVLALAWAGSLVSTTRPRVWAIAVPAMVAPVALFMRVGGSFYIDNLATFLSALALGVAILAVRHGVTTRRVVLTAVLSAAGMLTEATYIVTLLVSAGALVLAYWMHNERPWPARVARSLAIGLIPILAAAAASGWFYVRNKHLTGTYTGRQKEWAAAHLQRRTIPLWDVATGHEFWHGNLQLFRQSGGLDATLSPLLVEVLAGLAVLGWLVQLARHRLAGFDGGQAAVVLILVLQGVGILVTEIGYVSTGGAINTRYLLPALLPIGALLAAGLLTLPRVLVTPALALYLCLTWGFFVHWAWIQPIFRGSHLTGHTTNNVPWALVLVALVGLLVGIVLQLWAMLRALGERAAA